MNREIPKPGNIPSQLTDSPLCYGICIRAIVACCRSSRSNMDGLRLTPSKPMMLNTMSMGLDDVRKYAERQMHTLPSSRKFKG